jgi:hypothetical protein
MKRVGRSASALLSLFVGTFAVAGSASACSCVRPDRLLSDAEYKAWTLERAAIVVRGRISEVTAGNRFVRSGVPVFVAKMDVSSVLKGEAPTGEITLVSLYGLAFERGDCGAAHILLSGLAAKRDLMLEVRKINETPPGEYFIDICGYADVAAASVTQQ